MVQGKVVGRKSCQRQIDDKGGLKEVIAPWEPHFQPAEFYTSLSSSAVHHIIVVGLSSIHRLGRYPSTSPFLLLLLVFGMRIADAGGMKISAACFHDLKRRTLTHPMRWRLHHASINSSVDVLLLISEVDMHATATAPSIMQ